MKFLSIFALTLAIFVALTNARTNNYQWGMMRFGDSLLDKKIVTLPPKKLLIASQDYTFPGLGQAKNRKITEIQVTDLYKNGFASLKSGGPGSNTATINLKSQRGKGFRFLIEIYGH